MTIIPSSLVRKTEPIVINFFDSFIMSTYLYLELSYRGKLVKCLQTEIVHSSNVVFVSECPHYWRGVCTVKTNANLCIYL